MEQTANRIMRLPEVLRTVGVSKPTLYRHIKQRRFPAPRKLFGGPASGWASQDVDAWIEAQKEGV